MIVKLGELKLGELLDTPPPGLDEAIAISKVHLTYCKGFIPPPPPPPYFSLLLTSNSLNPWQVIQFLELEEYSKFTRIVFDTAPTVSKTLLLLLLFFMPFLKEIIPWK